MKIIKIVLITFVGCPQRKRQKWDDESCNIVMATFGNYIKSGSRPNRTEIQNLINDSPCLKDKRRTVAHIRAWMQAKSKQIQGTRSKSGMKNALFLCFVTLIRFKKC